MKTFTKTILSCWAILFVQYMTAQCSPTEVSFNFTGGLQSWTVPSGVTEITILAAGADGGNFSFPAGPSTLGGNGARITADFNVTPGDQLQIIVAGRGGNHPGLPFIGSGAGGGGATFIASGMGGFGAFNSTANLLLVAGGGGGAGSAVQGEGSNVESLLDFGLPGLPGIFSVFAAGGGATSINNGQFLPQSANAGGTAAVFGAAGGISNDLDANPFEVRRVNGGYGGGGAPGGSGGGGGGFSGGSGGPAALTGGFAGTSKSFGSNTVFDPASNNGSGFVRIFYATEDNAPVPNVSSLPSVTAQCEVTSLTAPTATDDCDGSITATRTVSLPITAQGTTVVTWTYTDGGGNTVTQTQNIIINDTTAPTASSLPNITAQCQVTSLTPPTATDNCEGTITGTTTASLPITAQGTTVVTWTFNDGNGNSITRNQNIIINDTTAPTASSLPNITAQCEVTSLTPPTATDNCEGTITGTTTASLPITAQGTTVVTWTFNDGNGNSVTRNQNIIINDTTAPTASSLPNITAQCQVTSLTPPTATDNCEGTITGTTTASLPITAQGTTVVTWTFNDGNGNSITQNQNIIIEDTIAPTMECPTNIDQDNDIGICGAVITYTTPLEMDNCSGAITTQTSGLPSGSTFQIGTTTNTFVSTDASGNSTTCSFDITINDTEAPIANCAAPFTIQLDANGLANITVADVNNGSTDNCAIESATIDIDTFDCSNVGSNSVTLTVTDVNGNTTSCTTMVTVEDLILPELVCQDITITLDENGEATIVAADVIATLTDVCGTPNASVDIDTFSCSDLGTPVLVTVLATDANGNTVTCTTTITVDDLLSPVFVTNTLPIDEVRIVDATGEYILEDFTIDVATTDNCTSPANITITQNPAAGTALTPGVYDITLFATDDLGNETDYMFELTVEEFLGTENITLSLATVVMYPNPARAQVILSNPQAIDLQTANIYDISGRLVKSFDLNGMGAQKLLDLTSLASAKYFVQIMTKNNVIIKQLIKE